ncbi:peptidoglycan DD-metalloendopeptidase family protein [Paenibacillus larvae]|uniref:murein hydrolase activator EnvC family protein n=1 Tax=Paenibacillus larvae TaxID=1464 RepID=UPI0022808BE9|nr:peptidoglycan DD-metalloendopeptidase family protein [Paenibacillus larvae]MCY9508927.1 peptidoglycan DD-metalloendopeptidase family protein [Paenibacillus larvae]MCY9524685.1 peptidoglycan DD-metalloendopeptidase family protein [Paenibacillus larvae]
MKKKFLPLAVACSLALSAVPYNALAASSVTEIDKQLGDLKNQQSEAEKKSKEAQDKTGQIQSEKAQVNKDINAIINELNATNEKLDDLNVQIATVTGNLEENAKQLDDAEKRVEARDQKLKSRVKVMYQTDSSSYIDVVLSSTSLTDFFDRMNALKSIVGQDKDLLEANKQDRDLIAQKKKEVENQLAEVKTLYAKTNDIKATLVAQEKEKQVKVASLSASEQQYVKETEEQEAIFREIAKKQKALQQQRVAALATPTPTPNVAPAKPKPGTGGSSGGRVTTNPPVGGHYGYPLPFRAPITSDYGYRQDPFGGQSSEFHNGVDLGAPNGTPILAAESGTVVYARWMNGYGNCVMIAHPDGNYTLYGHIRDGGIVVSDGQQVSRGQKIAEVGSTGNSTGNHLHFEVRKGGNAKANLVDPKPYIL